VAEAFAHLGFAAYFRVELSWAKLLGAALLFAPVPAWRNEWAYACFTVNAGEGQTAVSGHSERS
jgi:DoxX-like family